jgi:hypothetical protein
LGLIAHTQPLTKVKIFHQKIERMETGYVCKCNGCGSLLHDENPQVGVGMSVLSGEELSMIQVVGECGGVYWGCPICEDDRYLMDLG